MEPPVMLEGREVFTSASIGIAVYEEGVSEEEHLLRQADSALYRAKSRGKSRFEIFDEEMHSRAVALMEMEADIRNAVGLGQFRAVYQPVVRLEDRTVTGVEALLRWHHPTRGLVPNREFIPLALETGLIVPIGNWVLEEACRQMADWVTRFPDLPELKVSVNLAGKQLRQPNLVELVQLALHQAGLPPDRLLLEVSEEDLMMDADRNIETIRQL
jgi:predicted signal transduction protein with EAL and GGDEF domain